jgi:hypothetical protein
MTVLDYIKTSIEILMQIKDESNDLEGNSINGAGRGNLRSGLDNFGLGMLNSNRGGIGGKEHSLNDTGLSSTFKSIDLPPKEYEQ